MARGADPQDHERFAPARVPTLLRATQELSWLLGRGYAEPSALALVGNRHALHKRERDAVMRCACPDQARAHRGVRRVDTIAGAALAIDGFNCLNTLESALAGAPVFRGRDGVVRDIASVHGNWREVETTTAALARLTESLIVLAPASVCWFLDRPIARSGALAATIERIGRERGLPWRAEVVFDPDRALVDGAAVVASGDAGVLDRCGPWIDLVADALVRAPVASPWLARLDAGIRTPASGGALGVVARVRGLTRRFTTSAIASSTAMRIIVLSYKPLDGSGVPAGTRSMSFAMVTVFAATNASSWLGSLPNAAVKRAELDHGREIVDRAGLGARAQVGQQHRAQDPGQAPRRERAAAWMPPTKRLPKMSARYGGEGREAAAVHREHQHRHGVERDQPHDRPAAAARCDPRDRQWARARGEEDRVHALAAQRVRQARPHEAADHVEHADHQHVTRRERAIDHRRQRCDRRSRSSWSWPRRARRCGGDVEAQQQPQLPELRRAHGLVDLDVVPRDELAGSLRVVLGRRPARGLPALGRHAVGERREHHHAEVRRRQHEEGLGHAGVAGADDVDPGIAGHGHGRDLVGADHHDLAQRAADVGEPATATDCSATASVGPRYSGRRWNRAISHCSSGAAMMAPPPKPPSGHAGGHAAAIGEPLDQGADRRDVAQAQTRTRDDAVAGTATTGCCSEMATPASAKPPP
ncbi:MAG: DUF434 domain-containing protein [Nannocystaceae bacterium]